jgi:hypothetical protein
MATLKEPIKSARITLRFETASVVIGTEETHLVFPAIEFDAELEDVPAEKSLNVDPAGPPVVSVDVHQVDKDDARGGYYGHSGVDRLSLLLVPDEFAKWQNNVRELRDKYMEVVADIDEGGDIFRLSRNGHAVSAPVSSETRGLTGGAPPARTGTA